jgi:hypothetical protein
MHVGLRYKVHESRLHLSSLAKVTIYTYIPQVHSSNLGSFARYMREVFLRYSVFQETCGKSSP